MTPSGSGAVLAHALPIVAANRKQHSSTSASIDSVAGESVTSHDQQLLGLRGELDAPFDCVLNVVKKLGMANADPTLARAHSSDSFFLPGDDRVESLRGAASSHAALLPSHDKSGKTARDKGKSAAKDKSGTGSSTLVRFFGNDPGASSSGSAEPTTLINSGEHKMRGWSPLDLRQSNHKADDASSTTSSSTVDDGSSWEDKVPSPKALSRTYSFEDHVNEASEYQRAYHHARIAKALEEGVTFYPSRIRKERRLAEERRLLLEEYDKQLRAASKRIEWIEKISLPDNKHYRSETCWPCSLHRLSKERTRLKRELADKRREVRDILSAVRRLPRII